MSGEMLMPFCSLPASLTSKLVSGELDLDCTVVHFFGFLGNDFSSMVHFLDFGDDIFRIIFQSPYYTSSPKNFTLNNQSFIIFFSCIILQSSLFSKIIIQILFLKSEPNTETKPETEIKSYQSFLLQFLDHKFSIFFVHDHENKHASNNICVCGIIFYHTHK